MVVRGRLFKSHENDPLRSDRIECARLLGMIFFVCSDVYETGWFCASVKGNYDNLLILYGWKTTLIGCNEHQKEPFAISSGKEKIFKERQNLNWRVHKMRVVMIVMILEENHWPPPQFCLLTLRISFETLAAKSAEHTVGCTRQLVRFVKFAIAQVFECGHLLWQWSAEEKRFSWKRNEGKRKRSLYHTVVDGGAVETMLRNKERSDRGSSL